MKESIREKARELGFDVCRIARANEPASAGQFTGWIESGRHGQMEYLARNAHKRVNPQQVLAGAQSVICVALNYALPPFHQPQQTRHRSGGLIARYAQHADYHSVMGEWLKFLAGFIDRENSEARSLWYVDTGPVLEREFAQRAGIGFIGKHTNVISRRFGNWILLGEILTTLALEPDPPEKNHCGSCTRCLQACPTNAITAPFELDARLCISYLTIELKGSIPENRRPAIGNRIFGCDDCLEVCPWNRFASESRAMAQYRRDDLRSPELLELLSLDSIQFKQRFRGTPIERSKRRGLIRNVCVALGNVGGREALPLLAKAAQDEEPVIAEHAEWAIRRIEDRSRQNQV